MLRRDNEKKNEQIRFGVLCGTIVIIPAEAREALEQAIGMSGKLHSAGSEIFLKQIILK